MADDEILVERRGAIATVVFNRPAKRNAMTVAMWERLPVVLRELDEDPAVQVIVLRGAGKEAFGAGADIGEFAEHRSTAEKALAYNRRVGALMSAVATVRKPLIAMIYGACIGGACELAAVADLRIAAENAVLGIPAAKLGIAISMEEVRRLVELVGPANAKEILMSGRRFSAQRAKAMGLVNEVVPTDELEDYVYALAEEIAQNAPLSVRWAKEAVRAVLDDPSVVRSEAREIEFAAFFDTEDFHEGVRAFLEKRRPRFVGR